MVNLFTVSSHGDNVIMINIVYTSLIVTQTVTSRRINSPHNLPFNIKYSVFSDDDIKLLTIIQTQARDYHVYKIIPYIYFIWAGPNEYHRGRLLKYQPSLCRHIHIYVLYLLYRLTYHVKDNHETCLIIESS